MVTWTNEQQQAIEASGSDILVAAAAGSGKTAVLVERIIQKLMHPENPYNIDEILVATFTNAAAEEMRSRIGEALEKAISKDPSSYHLKKQLSLLQRASISTLHAFCTTVVRQYAYRLDVDPAFRIADEMEMDLIRQEVIDEVLEEAYSREGERLEQFFHVVDMFSSDRSDDDVGILILKLYQFAMENPWPEKWLHKVAEAYALPDNCTEEDLFWLHGLKRDVKDNIEAFRIDIERAMDIARESDGPYHYVEALEADLLLIDTALDCADDWNRLQAFFQESKLKALSRKKVECNEDKKEQIKQIRQTFRDDWNKMKKEWFSRNLDGHIEDMRTLYPAVKELTELVLTFKERFTAVKRDKAIVDFSDLEHFCLAILMDASSTEGNIIPTHVAIAYKQQFKEILVDEYQDINIVQETILSMVSDQVGTGNRFMVGDVKQSIYRFRHAEPTLFIQKYKQFAENPSDGLRIDLAKNFRSRKDVLTGANFIFRQLFDEALGDIEYEEDVELLYGNLSYDDLPLQDKETEVILVDRDNIEKPDTESVEAESVEDLINIQLEARVYANKIKQWIGDESTSPFKVVDKATNQHRDIQYRDIVILQRSLTGVATIVDELKKQGIPVYAELRSGYLVAIEIQVMLNMLKIIDNPYQDIPLASVLRSPIVGLKEEALARIRLAKKGASFYEALQAYVQQQDDHQLSLFLTQLEECRSLAREGALSELIWHIYRETGYYDFVGGIPGGRQRQANLRALYDRARGYEATSFRGLFRFLRFIERMQEEKKDLGEARALSEQEDVVRIMTIHKSKGLEFPVVLIGGIHKQFNFQDLRTKYMLDKDLGFATKFIDTEKRITYPTLYYLAQKQASLQKLLAEEMRVLYVAMTRAKEKLVMVGNVPSMEKLLGDWSAVLDHHPWVLPMKLRKKAKTYLDWIGPALVRHLQMKQLRDTGQEPDNIQGIVQDPSNWQMEVVPAGQLTNVESEQEQNNQSLKQVITAWDPSSLYDKGYYKKVDDVLSYEYPYQEATRTNAKQSVTEIKRRQEMTDAFSDERLVQPYRAPLTKRPRFMQEETSLSAAEIGTAMHAVMQHLSFKESYDIEKLQHLIDKLVQDEILTEKEADAIDLQAILAFLETDIATILKQTDHVEREVPFTYTLDANEVYPDWESPEMEKVFIQGVVDCLIHQDDGLIIVDYKTDSIHDDKVSTETISNLKDRYRTQLSLYSQAMEDITQQKVKAAYLYFFDKNLLIEMGKMK